MAFLYIGKEGWQILIPYNWPDVAFGEKEFDTAALK